MFLILFHSKYLNTNINILKTYLWDRYIIVKVIFYLYFFGTLHISGIYLNITYINITPNIRNFYPKTNMLILRNT